jgi:hypothetical protein
MRLDFFNMEILKGYKMIKKMLATTAIVASVISMPSMAEGKPGTGPNPFSDCGIGAALFKNNIAATISNVIWDIGTTAVTSATASPETCSAPDAVAAAFIFESHDSLMEEVAQGSGQHLTSLLNILDVNDIEQASIVSQVRDDMTLFVSSAAYIESTRIERAKSFYSSVMNAVATRA